MAHFDDEQMESEDTPEVLTEDHQEDDDNPLGLDWENITLPTGRVVRVEEGTGRDQATLGNKGLIVSGRAADIVLARCVHPLDGEKTDERWWKEQLEGDRLAALLYWRLRTLGHTWDMTWTCPDCDHKNKQEIEITRADVDSLPTYPNGDQRVVEFFVDGVRYTGELLSGQVSARIMKDPKARQNLTSAMTARRVMFYAGPEDKRGKPYNWNDSPARKNNKVANALADLEARVHLSVDLSCEACSHQVSLDPMKSPGFLSPGR